jgi:hypothetical protein
MGKTWTVIGRVTRPADRNLPGYLAAGYAPIGTVAATAVHGIRIRVGDTSTAYPLMINIVPEEFYKVDDSFGGHLSGDSGIYTDIPTGESIFRELAPFVGSHVLVYSSRGGYDPLPVNYSPQVGDRLLIIVRRPVNPLREVDIENKTGGSVIVKYADGSSSLITHVAKPVYGVGRFDGCSYTGLGAINTNHTCVITVSTAPISQSTGTEGSGVEHRGGFQIVPAYHNTQTEEAGSPQSLILGTPKSRVPELEGTPPLYYGYIGLASDPKDPEHSWRCQVKKAGGDQWEEMPEMIGDLPDAIEKLGITDFRIVHDKGSEDCPWLMSRIALCANEFQERRFSDAKNGIDQVVRGVACITPKSIDKSVSKNSFYVQYSIEDHLENTTNAAPYSWDWNTSGYKDGEYAVDIRTYDMNGNLLVNQRTLYWVDNSRAIIQAQGEKKTAMSDKR